jgi:hypothetical protein
VSVPQQMWLLGNVVPLTFAVYDAGGTLTDAATAALTITLPDASTTNPTLDHPSVGTYQVDYTPPVAGAPYVARLVTTGPTGAAEDLFAVIGAAAAAMTIAELRIYLRTTSATDAQLAAALTAERESQAQDCIIEPYTMTLREALARRVARNLAGQAIPLAHVTSYGTDSGTAAVYATSWDGEIDRLEWTRRRVPGMA